MQKNEPTVIYVTILILCIIVVISVYSKDVQEEGFTPCDVSLETLLDPTNGMMMDIKLPKDIGVSCVIT